MKNEFDRYKAQIIELLLTSRKTDPWSSERIATHLKIPNVDENMIKRLTRYIRNLIKFADSDSSLSVISNDGKGYFLPIHKDEFRKQANKRRNISKGFFRSAKHYEKHEKKAISSPQLELFADEGAK
ncbi:hypothetical protein H1S01_15775 [Heliobacterium chlorum]|uniref:Uncharacterized protein n=1 Tax=Heliobacterium chlorum TaxID=2698 RepID=A0ABR7T573_HELCL|nr:hypothetical protein [Heliobacterium chlorum]MBC9785944.1 hypothetical protein [Heliobacterium chlorum]